MKRNSQCCTVIIGMLLGTAVSINAATLEANMEGLGLAQDSFWNGSDLAGGFECGTMHFRNSYDTNWASWSGFAYSSINNTNTAGYDNQYAVWLPGTDDGGTGVYTVAYDNAWEEADIITVPCPSSVKGFYANNTTYAALSMRDGDAFAKKFGGASGNDADWFKLTVTGKDDNGTIIGTVDFHLADYRFTNNANDYIVDDWTWVNLTSLGAEVKTLHFSLSSSDNGAWGMNTPAYFALDGLEIVPHPAILEADLEDLKLGPDSFWNGSDESGGFKSEFVHFKNSYDTNWASWSGFVHSSINDTNMAGYGNQYAVWLPGTGLDGTGTYAVAYDNAWAEADVITFPFSAYAKGIYINNTTYAALSMRDGDAFAKQFGGVSGDDADWLKLVITGKNDDGTSLGNVEFYLADYRFTNNANDYIISDWTWVNLTSLGPDVKTLHFALSSSDNGAWGMNTPAYFALDGLEFVYSYSSHSSDENLFDPAVPGFVGTGGDGNPTHTNNYLNPIFAGWADTMVNYSPAPGIASQWTNTVKALGAVTCDNMDIVSLGDLDQDQIDTNVAPGKITLGFSCLISDESGPDFAVFENGFASGDDVFAELGYVEVSSDGTNFVRFPSVSLLTNTVGAFDPIDTRHFYNLCGKHVNNGNSWGTPFDLSDLASHTRVQDGTLDLASVTHVRIVDIPGSGDFTDAFTPANPIYDPWETMGSGGVDLEAIGVINSPAHAKIEIRTTGPGAVSPYGMPGPAVSVEHGSNITFVIDADAGHHIVDVRVNDTSIGRPTSHTFTNVLSDQKLEIDFGNILVVQSAYGTATPEAGTYYGCDSMTAWISGSPVANGTTQYVCTGWVGTGAAPTNGSGTITPAFNLTNDSTIVWAWQTNYWLEVQASSGGSVDIGSSWQVMGSTPSLTASAAPYYAFTGWSGDAQGNTNDPAMDLTMDRARSVQANFWSDETTNNVPTSWLQNYDLTNATASTEAMTDHDGDGIPTWCEFYAGTDPTNAVSSFQIIGFGSHNGSNYVTWVGGTNGSALPFTVLGCTNLASGWTVLDDNVSRAASGTNIWWSTNTADHMYYRINVDRK